ADGRMSEFPVVVYCDAPLQDADRARVEAAGGGLMVETTDDPGDLRERISQALKPAVLVTPTQPPAKPRARPEDLQRLTGRRVLVVDDDVRNIFALTSLLERYG